MKHWITSFILLTFSTISFAQPDPVVFGHTLEKRYVRISTNFLVDDNLPEVFDVITRASESCFNGVLIADVKFGFLDNFVSIPRYFNNLKTVLDSAKSFGLEIVPEVTPFGYSEPILVHNPNLAEGLPVHNAPFVVVNDGGQLILENDPNDAFDFSNGGFETSPTNGHNFPDWSWQDGEGTVTFWDDTESHWGNASARVTDPENSPNGNARIVQEVQVDSFRDYHLSFWIKTENFDPAYTNVLILNPMNGRVLNHNPLSPQRNQGWTKVDLTFNTLDSRQLNIYFGIWGGGQGSLWWDDIVIEPSFFNNTVRRPGAPVVVKDDNGDILLEGTDVDSIIDPQMGNFRWQGDFTIWHDQPEIYIPGSSSLKEGDKVYVDYFHTAVVNGSQVCASLTEPEVFDITEKQLSQIRDEFMKSDVFSGWFLQYDEIRVHGWDRTTKYGSPGDDLAFNFDKVSNQATGLDPNAQLFTWSDMFDPFHNARNSGDPYYLVDGYWADAWEGVDSSVTIFNWNSGSSRIESGQFFADRGHQQVLAGFYDQSSYYTLDWLEELKGVEGISGVMYTTWTRDFGDMEDWAQEMWGGCDFTSSNQDDLSLLDNIKVTPNPTSGNLTLTLPNQLHLRKVEGYNQQGQLVLESYLPSLNINNLPDGLYTLRIMTDEGIHQVIVMKSGIQ